MIKKYLDSLDNSLDKIHHSLTTPRNDSSIKNTSKQFTMKRYSLLDILQRAIPKHCPKTVQISLPNENVLVYGHMYKLIVLFSGLIENSMQAMRNSGTININATSMGSKLRIEIQDSGPGIPARADRRICATPDGSRGEACGIQA